MSIDKKKLLTLDNLVIAIAICLLVAWIPLMNRMGWNKPAPVPTPAPVTVMAAATATTTSTTTAAAPVVSAAVASTAVLPVTGETVKLTTPEFTTTIDFDRDNAI